MLVAVRSLVVLVCLVVVASVGGCEACAPPVVEPDPDERPCLRTDALDVPRACIADDDCACGAHCSFRSCVFDCKVDGDCSGGDVCDDFGRCSPEGQRTPPLRGLQRGKVIAAPATIAANVADTPYFVRIFPRSGTTGNLQLVSRGGALIWCPGAESPSSGCDLDGVPPGGVIVGMGLPSLPPALINGRAEARSMEVNDENGTLTSVVAFQVAGAEALPPDGPSMSGLYAGSARRGAGGGLLTAIALPGAETVAATLRHAVNATLVVDATRTGSLQLDDPTGLVLPVSPLVVAINAGTLNWPSLNWLTIPGTGVEVVTDAVAVPFAAPEGSFELTIPLAARGLALPGDAAPSLGSLTFNFSRTSPVPQGVFPGATTANAVATLNVNRGSTAFAAGTAWDFFAAATEPNPPLGEQLSGPWTRPALCEAGFDALPLRKSAVPSACSAARSPFPRTSDDVCPAAVANLTASDGLRGARFPCAYAITAPRNFCASLDPSTRASNWNNCIARNTGPSTCFADQECASNVCAAIDPDTGIGTCVAATQDQLIAECLPTTGCGSPDPEIIQVDRCAAAVAATGCQKVAVSRTFEPASAATLIVSAIDSFDINPNNLEQGKGIFLAFGHQETFDCVVPDYAPDQDCTIDALCTPTPETTTPAEFNGDSDAGDLDRRGTGDALCEGGDLPGALRGFTTSLTADAEVPDIERCAADLQSLVTLANGSAAVFTTAQLTDDSGCFSIGRLITAFDVAARNARSGRPADAVALGTAHRLVQQVAELQGLVARNALDNFRQQITFDGNDDPRPALASLDQSLAGWAFVLDPRVSGVLLATPGAILANPDFRADLGISIDPDASEGLSQGVSISLLETLSDQLALLDFALERAWLDGQQNAIQARRDTIASVLRTGSVVIAVADSVYAAAAATGDLAWEDGYQAARLNYASLVRRVLERNEAIDAGLNPLGIEDIDTPLFFAGDIDGDRARFTAVSRFLVGTGPGDARALASIAISEAQDALALARLDWRENASAVADSERRQLDIITRYGELITGYCGAPIEGSSGVDTFNVLDQPLDVESCFLEPRCRARPEDFTEVTTTADIGFEICTATRAGLAVGGLDNQTLASTLGEIAPAFTKNAIGTGAFPIKLVRLEQNVNRRVAVVRLLPGSTEIQIPLNDLGSIGATITPAMLSAGDVQFGTLDTNSIRDCFQAPSNDCPLRSRNAAQRLLDITADCRASQEATARLRPTANPGTCVTADDCRIGDKCAESTCVNAAQPDILDQAECYYDGAISEQALAVRSAGLEVEVARAELDEFIERYDIARGSCALKKQGANEQEVLLREHNETMTDLNIGRTVAASIATTAENARECAAASVGIDATTPVTAAVTGGAAGVACVAAATAALADVAVLALDNAIASAERKHDAAVLAAQNDTDLKVCMQEADQELVGVKAQTLRIRQAQQAQAAAVINLRGQKSYTAGLWADGNAFLAKERRIAESAALGRFVLSDAAELYIDRFRYAQRLTYVAVRAVEYEFQAAGTQNRAEVIGAANPVELEAVLRDLAATLNSGTVNGSQPTGLLAVVSLRDHMLQLADLSGNSAGEQTLTAEERLRLLLTSPTLSVFDDNDTYLGQQVPFTLAPLGALGLGNTAGIPIVAQSDCAERLWGVNAAIIGGDELFDGESSSFTRLDLLQRNTFSSQSCSAVGEPIITSTTRPSINLLADYSNSPEQPSPATATAQFARGLMQPYLNVTRAEFEREDFSQGSTTQLAGRGLFGDYAIFIPAAALSVDGGPGLKLDAVDDILLRFDYTAVAR